MSPAIESCEGQLLRCLRRRFFLGKEVTRVLTDTAIRRSPDCAPVNMDGCLAMTVACSVGLSDEEKLSILRRRDQFRQWHSLDEKRYCLVCGEIFTGREIEVIKSTDGNGPLKLICPTEHCHATPMEWVPPSEDVLIKIAMVEAECHWVRQVRQAGRATQSYQRSASNRTSRTRSKPRLG